MFYGVCTVNVPKPAQVAGFSGFVSAWFRIGNRHGRARVESYERFSSPEAFTRKLAAESTKTDERGALVFLHGYATSFSDAVVSAARISLGIKHGGPTAIFSWASKGDRAAYGHDEKVVEKSRRQLIDFLTVLNECVAVDHVDIVVHSLGNRLFLRSLKDWFDQGGPPDVPLRNAYLGAPDVDQAEFYQDLIVFERAAAKTTLYGSNTDSALLASVVFHHGVARAGLMPPPVTKAEIDTIETSLIDATRVRHAYIIDSAVLRADIFGIQRGLVDPDMRPNTQLAGSKLTPDYWRLT